MNRLNIKLLKWFKIPEKPHCGTLEEWDAWYESAEKTSPFGFLLTETIVPKITHWVKLKPICSAYDSVLNKISNIKMGGAKLRTDFKPWDFCDVDILMEQSLFYGLIDFIEIECFYHSVWWDDTHSPKINRWKKYPRFIRAFLPHPVKRVVRREMGIRTFKAMSMVDLPDCPQEKLESITGLLSAYYFAVEKWENNKYLTELGNTTGYNKIILNDKLFSLDEPLDKKQIRVEHFKQMDLYDQEVQIHLMNIIKNRRYLWT